MFNRLRLLQGAMALLYFGPLLAGLGGFGWAVVPVFAAIFMLWLFILRPKQWPRTLADWGRPEALIALLTQIVVQVLLVVVSFGIGRGIGGVLGTVPPFPLMLPVAISFLSIPLARMFWNPWEMKELDSLLDDALTLIEDGQTESEVEAAHLRDRVQTAGRLVAELGRLPDDTPPEVLVSHLMAMSTQVGHDALRVALMDPIYDGSASALHWRAAVVHATEPAVADALAGSTYPMALFHEVQQADLVDLFATRCAALIIARPGVVEDCPAVSDISEMATRMPATAKPLAALADVILKA